MFTQNERQKENFDFVVGGGREPTLGRSGLPLAGGGGATLYMLLLNPAPPLGPHRQKAAPGIFISAITLQYRFQCSFQQRSPMGESICRTLSRRWIYFTSAPNNNIAALATPHIHSCLSARPPAPAAATQAACTAWPGWLLLSCGTWL